MAVEMLPDTSPTSAPAGVDKALFSVEQLTEHARLLAVAHQAEILPGANHLLARLDENERLLRAYNR
jgi:hypothetical protein